MLPASLFYDKDFDNSPRSNIDKVNQVIKQQNSATTIFADAVWLGDQTIQVTTGYLRRTLSLGVLFWLRHAAPV